MADATRDPSHLERARQLLSENPLIDGHNDFPYIIRGWFLNNFNNANFDIHDLPIGQTDLTRLRKGRVGGQFWSAYVPIPKAHGEAHKLDTLMKTLRQIDVIHNLIERYPEYFGAVNTSDDVTQVFQSGRIASLIGVEGLHQIGGSVSAVRLFHRLGVRYITLCHDDNNEYADSATGKTQPHGGLSDKGEDIIREMNRIGMMIDLSHTSEATQKHVLRLSTAPVIFSHSSCSSLCPNPRNTSDEVLDSLKVNGGIIMICFLPDLIDPDGGKSAKLSQVADHIIYAGERIGYDHVGIGSDFDGMLKGPVGLDDVSCYPNLVGELLSRGLSNENLIKVMGGNIVRVLREVEEVPRQSRSRSPILCDELDEVWTMQQKEMLRQMGGVRGLCQAE